MSDWSVLGLTADPTPGNPALARQTATRLTTEVTLVQGAAGTLRNITGRTPELQMGGDYSARYAQILAQLPTDVAQLETAYQKCAAALTTFAQDLEAAQALSATALKDAAAAAAAATPPYVPGIPQPVPANPPQGTGADAQVAAARGLAQQAASQWAQAVARCVAAIKAALATSRVDVSAGLGRPIAAGLLPPVGNTPQANATWWAGLSAAQKKELLAQYPELVANRDGIPAAVRDQANRAMIPRYEAGLAAQLRAAQARLDHYDSTLVGGPSQAGRDPARRALLAQLQLIKDKQASLHEVQQVLARGNRQLLYLDLSHDRAEAAIAVGNVDTAAHVGVLAVGFTSTVQSIGGNDTNVSALRDKAMQILEANHDTASVATVTWLGYQAPQWSNVTDPHQSVLGYDTARSAGHPLAGFVSGISAARRTPVDVTLLGHSYGSTVAGYALREHTGVSRVAFFGSPGIATDTLSTLKVPSGGVYNVAAFADVVASSDRFGPNPEGFPGVHRISSDPLLTPDGQQLRASIGHSAYLDPGTTSQYGLAAVVAGHPEDVPPVLAPRQPAGVAPRAGG